MPPADPESAFRDLVVADGAARAVLRAEHAARLCEGHFPGDPFVPGALLAGLMADLAAPLVARDARLVEVVRCVFRARVVPDERIVLTARIASVAPHETRIEAEVRAHGRAAARATLRFAHGR